MTINCHSCLIFDKEGGVPAYFQGNLAAMLKVVPEYGVKFYTYETIKRLFTESDASIKTHERLIAGAFAGAVADCAVFPLEVIKTHLAVAKPGAYTSILHAFETIRKNEGPVRPFYRGLSASLLSTIPHTSINFTSYELLKNGEFKKRKFFF
jgi:solute carrier family 25 phosphate transporter 23/24/25/41